MVAKRVKRISRRDALKMLGAAAGASVLANLPSKWSKPELASGALPAHAQTSVTPPTLPPPPALPTVDTLSIVGAPTTPVASFFGVLLADGGSPILDRGFVWAQTVNPTLADHVTSVGAGALGPFSALNVLTNVNLNVTLHGRAYATNSVGTAFGTDLTWSNVICLVEGTLITLADGTVKKIEDIEYADRLLVWNFDEGRFDAAPPLWIKRAEETSEYNLLEFSDGSSLRTINQHRIFNKEKGMFTYPMTDDTPLGTTTFNVRGEEVTLVSKRTVSEQVKYYNVITDRHINLFADGILTSCRYNNIYPIADMKFVKDERMPVPASEYGLADRYYEGLRLAEQTIPVAATVAYVRRLEMLDVEGVMVTTAYSIRSEAEVELTAG